jgi:tRNA threonylcarbamoyladenosine biosynthesis protein TsaB
MARAGDSMRAASVTGTWMMAGNAQTCLGLDAAGHASVVVVRRGATTLASAVEPMRHGQAEHLVPMIERVLAEAGIVAADLDVVGATTGPGGFTGVRIGLATARGYGLGLGIPVVGASRFAVVAAAAGARDRRLLVAIDTRRDDVALQCVDTHGRPTGDPWTAPPETVATQLAATPYALAGDAAEPVAAALRAAGRQADVIAGTHATDPDALGRVLLDAGRAGAGSAPRPFYMRGADVTPAPNTRSATEGS